MRMHLPTPESTDRIAASFARTRPSRAIVHLRGDLGAGKSTFARAMLRTLGVQGAIRSPTYTLVERYPLDDGGDAVHLDLYRIGDPGELEFLGLDAGEGSLWLVEWPERGGSHLPPPDLDIALALEGDGRSLDAVAGSAVGDEWLTLLAGSTDLAAFVPLR
jgi:tRNA threonylcarbamoyladenosine biosynthesis protein TsaE